MVVSLEMHRDGRPVPGFLGVSRAAEYDRCCENPGAVLGSGELAEFEQMKFARRRTSYLLGRLSIKRALGALLEERRMERLEIRAGVFGQPLLCHPEPAQAEISVAHSAGLAVGAACSLGHPVGIDVELIDPERQDVLSKVFPHEEFALFRSKGAAEPAVGFLLWAVREALSKVLRCGLTVPFEVLRLSASRQETQERSGDSYNTEFVNFPQYRGHSWIIGGYALGLVIPKNTVLGFRPHRLLAEFCEGAPETGPGFSSH